MPLMLLALGAGVALGGTPTEFAAGSVIVPMDYEYQDQGILDAYGLVVALLDEGVPVHWVIDSGKERDDPDLDDLLTLQPFAEHAEEVEDHSFAGGPFVVAQADAEVALSVAEAWRGAGWAAVVHVAAGSFTGEVSSTLRAAPSLAIFADGNEDIAWAYLNAAGIPDAEGEPWSASSPGILTEAELQGDPDIVGDGALFDEDGSVRYCHLDAMHFKVDDPTPVTAEIRRFTENAFTSVLFECEAAASFENDTVAGSLLAAGDLTKVKVNAALAGVEVSDSSTELLQMYGSWGIVGGSLPDFTATFNADVEGVSADDGTLQAMIVATGHLGGDPDLGRVSYLGGHDYAADLPYSDNPEINGIRVFLNSLLTARCVSDPEGFAAPTEPAPTTSTTEPPAPTTSTTTPETNETPDGLEPRGVYSGVAGCTCDQGPAPWAVGPWLTALRRR